MVGLVFLVKEKLGTLQLAKEIAKKRNVKVRILMPTDNVSLEKEVVVIEELKQYHSDHLVIRHIEQMTGDTKPSFLVVDRSGSLVMEIKDDSKETSYHVIGQLTYSNSKIGVSPYVTIFDKFNIG